MGKIGRYPIKSIHFLRAKFFRRNINIYLYFVLFLHIDATQVFEILSQIRQEPMAADVMATWGAGASAAMILTYLNPENLVPGR